MVSLAFQAFSAAPTAAKLYPQLINLSGNIFYFSIPENFSKAMPAYDIVNALDITDVHRFDDGQYGNLVRRWWDIKEPGWFGKKLGAVMMDLSVQRVSENKRQLLHARPYDLSDRMDIMLMLQDRYHQRYDQLSDELNSTSAHAYHSSLFSMDGQKIETSSREYIVNQQKWIENGVTGPGSEFLLSMILPVTPSVYLDATFLYSKNNAANLRHFLDTAFAKTEQIKNSFRMSYAPGNPFAK